ncbi:hypothetical protein [Ruegeria sp. HKCCSP335]|uniref:hypothetical protein n=1 Tax=Ruegeria sp. HKCCSP335 TaxID=2794833 RepID=UPI001AE4047D|nr:hypothetical protein [Ruegeria sp. HKCCSP335]
MSKSEKRKLERLLGIRVSTAVGDALNLVANRYGVSGTSVAREAIIRFLEDELPDWRSKPEDLVSRKSPRGRGPTKPSVEAMEAASFVGEMGRIGNLTNQAVAMAHSARKGGVMSEQHTADIMDCLMGLKALEEKILDRMDAVDSGHDQNTDG